MYGVALDELHMQELVLGHAPPPPTPASATAASMVPPLLQRVLAVLDLDGFQAACCSNSGLPFRNRPVATMAFCVLLL